MNKKLSFGALAAIASLSLYSCQQPAAPAATAEAATPTVTNESLLQIVEDLPTTQAFLKDPIPDADIQRIVNAGINAPSAMNKQPWHFTVVSNAELIQQMAQDQQAAMKKMQMPPKAGEGDKPKPPTSKGPKSAMGEDRKSVV